MKSMLFSWILGQDFVLHISSPSWIFWKCLDENGWYGEQFRYSSIVMFFVNLVSSGTGEGERKVNV